MAVVWTGGPGDWATGSNWSTGAPPTSSQDALVSHTGSGLSSIGVTIEAATTAAAQSLTLDGSTAKVLGSITLSGALTLTSASSYLDLAGGDISTSSINGAQAGQDGYIYGFGAVNASAVGGAYFVAHGGRLVLSLATASGYSSGRVDADSTLELVQASPWAGVYFAGLNATLQIDAPHNRGTSIQSVNVSDVIDLRGVAATSVTYSAGGELLVAYGAGQSLSYQVTGNLAGDVVSWTSDGAGGTNIFWTAPPQGWTGGAGDWSTTSHWGTGHMPTASDDAVINNTGSSATDIGVTIAQGTNAVAHSVSANGSTLAVSGSLTTGVLTLQSSDIYLLGGSISTTSITSSSAGIHGYGSVSGSLSSLTLLEANGGTLISNDTGQAFFRVDADSRFEVAAAASSYVTFNGRNATLQLDSPSTFSGGMSGMALTDTIDLRGIVASSVSYSNSTLTVRYNGGEILTFNMGSAPVGAVVSMTSDGAGGTNVFWRSHAGSDVDLSGDGPADLLFHNTLTGQQLVWNGGSSSQAYALAGVGNDWDMLTGDFNGDGRTDLLFHSRVSSAMVVWYGGQSSGARTLAGVGNDWTILTGDFDGDGKTDLLFHNKNDSRYIVWNGGDSTTAHQIGAAGNDWTNLVGDFNGDGKADLLFHNVSTGDLVVWNGGDSATSHKIGGVGTDWDLFTGDFDGDGKSDLLFHNRYSGQFVIWNGGDPATSHADSGVGMDWTITTGDLDGDGRTDLVFHNVNTGAIVAWNGADPATQHQLGGAGAEWQLFG